MTVTIEPKDQKRLLPQGKVKIFFVGVEYHNSHKGAPPPVRVKTIMFPIPKLGEWIVLDDVYAQDLIFKTRHKGKPSFVSEEDGGAQMAEYIKEALADGKNISLDYLEQVKARKIIQQIPDEVLFEALRQRAESDNIPEELLAMLKQDKKKLKKEETPAPSSKTLFEPEAEEDLKSRLRKPKE